MDLDRFRPRRVRFVRDPGDNDRIVGIRDASDPWWDLDWMRDTEVQLFFAALDARDGRVRLREFDPLAVDDEDPERVAERHRRALARSSGRRIRW